MRRRARTFLKPLGLLAALLFALTAVLPATPAAACADQAPAEAVAVFADACDDPACEDCVLACGHGCCHAPHAASPGSPPPVASAPAAIVRADGWSDSPGVPQGSGFGLERPPRV